MYSTWERWENEMREEARNNAIEVLIQDNLEEGISEERILEKLQKRFSLDEEQAKAYFDKHACVES